MCKNPACRKVDILLRFSTRKSGLILGCAIGFLVWSLVINFPLLHHGFKFVFFQVMRKGNVIWMIWLPFCWLKGYRKIDFQSWKEIALADGIFGSEHSVDEFGFYSAASFCKQLSNISHDLPRFFQPSKTRPEDTRRMSKSCNFSSRWIAFKGHLWALGGWYWCWVFQSLSERNFLSKTKTAWEMLAKFVHSVASGSGNPLNDSFAREVHTWQCSQKKKLPLVFALSLRDTGESTSMLVSPTSAAFANDSYHMCNFMISFPDPNNCPSLLNMGQRWGHYWVRWGDTFAEGFSLQRRKFHTLLFETWELSEQDLKMQHLEALERNFFYIPQCQNLPKKSTINYQTYQNPSHLRLKWRHPAFSRIIDAATSVFDHLPRPSSPSGCGSGGARLPW